MASGGEKRLRKLWKNEDMVATLESVKSKALTVTQATTTYNIDNGVKGRVVHGMNPGRDTVLSLMEDKALCNYLVYMAERGFPLTCSMMAFAWAIALCSGNGSCFNPELGPGERWWTGFRKWNSELTLRKVD